MSTPPRPGKALPRPNHARPARSTDPERTTRDLVNFAEQRAGLLRRRVGVGPRDRLDPRALAGQLKLIIIEPSDVNKAASEDYALITEVDAKAWSGMGKQYPDGRLLVMLHPTQTPERATVTIMEEIVHAYLGHQPSRLVTQLSGLEKREYNEKDEQEAYWTAAAALLPREIVARAVWRGQSADDLAAAFGVSRECAEFRIKTLNLWSEYKAHGARVEG